MRRIIRGMLCLCLLWSTTGCTMCQSTQDNTYAAYGGRWPRHDRVNGRVGSPLSEAGSEIAGLGKNADTVTEEALFHEIDEQPPLLAPPSR